MAGAAILNFESRLPFQYYCINRHQILWKGCESDIKRNYNIKNAYSQDFKMAAAAILNFKNRLPYQYYWTDPFKIWFEC